MKMDLLSKLSRGIFCKAPDKKKRAAMLLAYIVAGSFFVLFLKPVYLVSILIVLVPPALANFFWLKNSRKKVLVFSIATTLLFALPVELSCRLADVWDVQSVLPRIFGLIPLENILFAFLNFFWILSFYEYFIDDDRLRGISKRFKYLIGLYLLLNFAVFGLYLYNSQIVALNYFTMALLVLIVPASIIYAKKISLIKKAIWPTIFFALVFFIYETVSLVIGSWWWPGEYLLSFQFFGQTFPIDDVIIWYFLSTPALIGGYEYFCDDWK